MLSLVERRCGLWLRCLAGAVAVCFLLCTVSEPAFAIVITNVSDPGYLTGNSDYTGVTEVFFNYVGQPGTFLCSGALISDFQVLTAGHCASGTQNWSVTFETTSGTTSIGVTQASVHPDFGLRPALFTYQYDVAILTLAVMAPSDAARYAVLTSFSGGFPATPIDIVGFGYGGNATGILPSEVRRHAVNTIDGLFSYPDSPLQMSMIFGAEPGNYGLIYYGDSGGPAFFDGQIIGVATFGYWPPLGVRPDTSTNYVTGYANLLDATTGDWVAGSLIPEPGAFGLLASGLAGLLLFGRRRARRAQGLHGSGSGEKIDPSIATS